MVEVAKWQTEPPNEWQDYSFEYSEVDDSAFQGNHRGMRSIMGTEFGENILNAAFDRIFRDGKLGGDLLIRISSRYQSKYFNLSGRQRVLQGVRRAHRKFQRRGSFCRHELPGSCPAVPLACAAARAPNSGSLKI